MRIKDACRPGPWAYIQYIPWPKVFLLVPCRSSPPISCRLEKYQQRWRWHRVGNCCVTQQYTLCQNSVSWWVFPEHPVDDFNTFCMNTIGWAIRMFLNSSIFVTHPLNSSCLRIKENQIPKSDFYPTNWPRGKSAENHQFSIFAQNWHQTGVNFSIFRQSWHQKVVSVLNSVVQRPTFLYPKTAIFGDCGCKKMGLWI